MLRISREPLSSSQAKTYHKLDYTSKAQSYYKQNGAMQGEWQGQLAEKYGLKGAVSAEEFSLLADGKHPQTGDQLVKHRNGQEYTNADGTTTKPVEHRAGWDATFSPAKSVSITALVGGDERVRDAHNAAVTTALAELERYTQARIGGNNPAETTGKFIAATFEHDTARPVDGYAAPQLHTHAVIFNVTERGDGTTRALQSRSFYDSQSYVTAVYQAELTHRLSRLGYEFETGKSGVPEIKGYTEEYLAASSLRSEQIRLHMEGSGQSGPAAAQIAALATRDRKQTLSREEVLAAHRELASEYGNQADRVIAEARARTRGKEQLPDGAAAARQAVTYTRASNYEREAVVDERVLMRDALRRGMGEATFAQVRAEFETRTERGEFHQLTGSKHATGRSFTTPETIAHERANVAHVLSGRNSFQPIATDEKAKEQADSRPFLNEAQRTVIHEVLTSRDRVHGLQGLAGTGKTTTLEAIREGAEQNGYAVEGFAPTSRAAGQLREAGVNATTLQSFLVRGGQGQTTGDPDSRHLYLLDESSLASTQQMKAFLVKIQPQDRVLVIGDTQQHQGVEAGKPFQQMQDGGMRTAQLDQIMRQKDPELLKAVEHLAKNETAAGVNMLAEQGRVTELSSAQERTGAIAKDYAARPDNSIIVSPDNRSRQQINQAVRTELQAKGTLAAESLKFKTMTHRSDMTGADRTWAVRYQPGNVVEYITGSKDLGIQRGSSANVLSTNARENTVTVQREDGQTVTYNPTRLRGVNVYQVTERDFATGDRLQFTSPNKKLGIVRRDLGTVTKVEANEIKVRMDGKDERTITFDPTKFRAFDHGYAITSYSAQGLTAGRVIANIDTDGPRGLINSRLAYVAISRASEDAHIYTNDAASLGAKLATEHSKTSAVDFRQPPPAKVEERQTRVQEYAHPEHRLAAVARDYTARPDRAVVIAHDATERRELTQLIRADLQAQGRVAADSRSVPVLIELHIGNPKVAANYSTGDQIHYRTGSPELHGLPHNGSVLVVSADAKRNILTMETNAGERVAYNPSQLRVQTAQSKIYREDTRELAVGDRIRLTISGREQRIRSGDFATVERIGQDNSIGARLDNGKAIELNPDKAKHIEYGYSVEAGQRISADRVLVTGQDVDAKTIAGISPAARELAIYTSDGSGLQKQQSNSPSNEVAPKQIPPLQQQNQGYGLGLGL